MIRHHYGLTCGRLVSDDTDNKRSTSAHTLTHLYKLRDKESGGYIWGQSLLFLLVVTPTITFPVGVSCYQPALELSAWDTKAKALKKQGVPSAERPPQPSPNPHSPTKQALALRLFAPCTAPHPTFKVHCITADALYGTVAFVNGASVLCGGVQIISQLRSHQNVRVHQRDQHVADYCATHLGTPQTIHIRGGGAVEVLVGSARLYVCAHRTTWFIVALNYAGDEPSRYLRASDLTWRTLDLVQGHTRRWLVEGFVQDWKSPEGWSQLTKQPGEEGHGEA